MIVRVREWYAGRSSREQRLLLLMLAIATPLLAWLAVVQPLSRAYDDALREQLEAVDRHGRVLALADTAKVRQSVGSSEAVDLQLLVTESASQAGIALQAVNASGPDSVDVTITDESAIAVAEWLRGLEARAIAADELRMTPATDGTIGTTVRLVRVR